MKFRIVSQERSPNWLTGRILSPAFPVLTSWSPRAYQVKRTQESKTESWWHPEQCLGLLRRNCHTFTAIHNLLRSQHPRNVSQLSPGNWVNCLSSTFPSGTETCEWAWDANTRVPISIFITLLRSLLNVWTSLLCFIDSDSIDHSKWVGEKKKYCGERNVSDINTESDCSGEVQGFHETTIFTEMH